MTEATDQPSFWRWLWKGGAKDRTGWQLAFALLLVLVTGAVTIPLWTWLASAFGSQWGFQSPAILNAILIAGPGMTAAAVTASTCRPDDLRSWLLTGIMGFLVGIVSQTGLAVAAATVLSVKPDDPVTLYTLTIVLAIVFFLPILGLTLATAYFLGWRRIIGREGIAPPPTA